jgi:hypothetical protein
MSRKSGQICVQPPASFATNKDMRFAAFALMAGLAGCSLSGNGSGSECTNDSQCGDDVCARSGECLPSSSVHAVTVSWTVNSEAAATSTSCSAHPDLYLQFNGVEYGDAIRFAPVPCVEGQFFVDKLPTRYQSVELGVEGGSRFGDGAAIDPATASAKLDLFVPAPSAASDLSDSAQ